MLFMEECWNFSAVVKTHSRTPWDMLINNTTLLNKWYRITFVNVWLLQWAAMHRERAPSRTIFSCSFWGRPSLLFLKLRTAFSMGGGGHNCVFSWRVTARFSISWSSILLLRWFDDCPLRTSNDIPSLPSPLITNRMFAPRPLLIATLFQGPRREPTLSRPKSRFPYLGGGPRNNELLFK